MALTDKLAAIADAIRAKAGTTDTMTLAEMPDKISAIQTGGGGATEPYVEETYDGDGNLTSVNMVGYTKIRKELFLNLKTLTSATLSPSISKIENSAFYGCSSLVLTSLPSSLTSIETQSFFNCKKIALQTLPSGLQTIPSNVFWGCSSLSTMRFPSSIQRIESNVFNACTGLTSITFDGTPTYLSNICFNGCANITTINVPWDEGEVENAPWGATNATINYNYTGG